MTRRNRSRLKIKINKLSPRSILNLRNLPPPKLKMPNQPSPLPKMTNLKSNLRLQLKVAQLLRIKSQRMPQENQRLQPNLSPHPRTSQERSHLFPPKVRESKNELKFQGLSYVPVCYNKSIFNLN